MGPSGTKYPRMSRRAERSSDVGLSHIFSVKAVSEISNLITILNSETSVELEEYYRVCMEEFINELLMEKGPSGTEYPR